MRFLGPLSIAVAALLGLAAECWAQTRGNPVLATRPQPPTLSQKASPPKDVAGTWVSDEPVTGRQTVSTSVPPTGTFISDRAEFESADEGFAVAGNGSFGDLWTEVHSCHRFWFQADTLAYWTKGNPLPPLVTTSPVANPPPTNQFNAGVLGESGTSVLFGGQRVDQGIHGGGKIELGYWLVDGEFFGVSGYYLGLIEGSTTFDASSAFSNGSTGQILARPFFDVARNMQNSALLAFPNFNFPGTPLPTIVNLDGSVHVRTTIDVQSAGLLLRNLMWIDFHNQSRVDLVSGYRFFKLDDGVAIDDMFRTDQAIPFISTRSDRFIAHNQFHGGELGLQGQIYRGRLSFEMLGKVALGDVRETVRIDGVNTVIIKNTDTRPGGLLAQPSNIGDYTRDRFAVLPEAGIKLRYDLNHNVRATLGYSAMWLDKVVRSGQQIDLGLNPTKINGEPLKDAARPDQGAISDAARPAFAFHESSFWVQGIDFGLEFRY